MRSPFFSNLFAIVGNGLMWFLAGSGLTALLMTSIYLTDNLPMGPMQDNLKKSFADGSLQDEDWPEGNRRIGLNQYNDCLLVMMIRFRPDSALESTVAPVVAFGSYPTDLTDEAGKALSQCQIARRATFADDPRSIYEDERYWPYNRYVHAYRIPFSMLISVVPVSAIRELYRWTGLILLIGLLAVHAARGLAARSRGDGYAQTSAFCFATIVGVFILFFGIDLFGTSLTHGPADILLYAALSWLSLRRLDPSAGAWDLSSALLGAAAFSFEFLHGTLPLMMAIILGSAALRSFVTERPFGLFSATRLVCAFVLGVAGAAGAKLTAIWLVGGQDGLDVFFDQLSHRMNGAESSFFDLAFSLYRSSYQIGWGARGPVLIALTVGLMWVLAAAGAALTGLLRTRHRDAALIATSSVAVIFAWFSLFQQHSIQHATFMVRLLVWPIGMGFACALILLDAGRSARLERSHPIWSEKT